MTHVAFNPSYPIIVIGDDRGVLRIFKLGPNLRKMSAPNINELNPAEEQQKVTLPFAFLCSLVLLPSWSDY